jgi:hypothetical protein
MATLLRHDDISKMYYKEKNIEKILPEIVNEMVRLVKRYPYCLNDASFIYKEFTYISTIMVEAGFVRRFVGPLKLEIKKPITKAKEWFGRKFLELTNMLPQIHKDHSGGIDEAEYKKLNELATQERLAQEQKNMNELRIRIPTIQIVVRDEWNGLYD